jgi:hypothetical protein
MRLTFLRRTYEEKGHQGRRGSGKEGVNRRVRKKGQGEGREKREEQGICT